MPLKRLNAFFVTSSLIFAPLLSVVMSVSASAQSTIQQGANAARGTGQPSQLFGDSGVLTTVTNTMLFVVGALAVIMIIFGGIRYATSGGNASSVTAAKNTVMYAIVGLIIAFLAFAAVNWVLGTLMPGSNPGFSNV